MATCWYLPGYTASDRDPLTHEILPGAMPPGIYCEDEATYQALFKGSREQGQTVQPEFRGVSLGGMSVYVATPAQAEILRLIPDTKAAPQPEIDPMIEISAKVNALMDLILADEHARAQVLKGKVIAPDGSVDPILSDGFRRKRVTPHPLRIPGQMNRAARRAAASRRRA